MEYSPELKKVIDILASRISMDGHVVRIENVNYGALEQIFDAYAAVKIRRLAALPDLADVNKKLYGWANAVEKGLL